MITGGVLSFTVTVNMQVADPQPLVAVMVTVVVPLLKEEPLPVPGPEPVVAPVKRRQVALRCCRTGLVRRWFAPAASGDAACSSRRKLQRRLPGPSTDRSSCRPNHRS